ncbi:MAG: MFS transporter [Methanobrevibacter sp.]|nr:MFS transporter [Methanobrevibacter sp.]
MNFANNINRINLSCYALYVFYALLTLTILGYGVYFLQNFGFEYIEIGMAIGISALISSIVQPLIGRFADIKHYSWKSILIILSIIMFLASLGLFFAPKFLFIYLFCLMVIVLGCMYPFLNNAVFYYEHHGVKTNYEVSRGFGLLSYMIFAALVGLILVGSNIMIINVFSLVASVSMILIVVFLPYYGYSIDESVKDKSKSFKNNVLFKYPVFTLAFISVSFFMIFHQGFMCYMINIFTNVGGNIADVSFANSLGALLELPAMFLFAHILKKVSLRNLIILASVLYVVRSLVILTAQNPLGIYISLILHMFTFAIIIPASVHLTDEIISEEDKNEGQAFMGSTLTIGIIFANLIGGNILQLYDVNLLLLYW